MNNWIFDGKDVATAGGAAITWHDHRFFDITHNGVVFHGEIMKINHRVFQVKRKGELDEIIASLGFDKPKIRKLKELAAPMPGRVTSIHIELGQAIQPGDAILSLEAMKMEQPLTAHKSGIVTGLNAEVGTTVPTGTALMEIK